MLAFQLCEVLAFGQSFILRVAVEVSMTATNIWRIRLVTKWVEAALF